MFVELYILSETGLGDPVNSSQIFSFNRLAKFHTKLRELFLFCEE